MANQVFASCLTSFVPYTEPYLSQLKMTYFNNQSSTLAEQIQKNLIENEFTSCDFQDLMTEIFLHT